jgi:radical SAM/Cys-rich protein
MVFRGVIARTSGGPARAYARAGFRANGGPPGSSPAAGGPYVYHRRRVHPIGAAGRIRRNAGWRLALQGRPTPRRPTPTPFQPHVHEGKKPVHATLPLLRNRDFPAIARKRLETLQVNVGYRCNQTCVHCHVNAGPNRTEVMPREVADTVLAFLRNSDVKTLDLTGGAPELNPHFRYLVTGARQLGVKVMDRCNLTILNEPGEEDLAGFLAAHQVEVVASLPCYLEDNVDRQRGKGVFSGSMTALRKLNALGYGKPGAGLVLNLVYNPQGTSLPPAQAPLEDAYRAHLRAEYGVEFNRLFTMANMPIARFGSMLISKGQFNAYMTLLQDAYREENLGGVMCRSLLSVDWQGYVYDCDFNQMLELPARLGTKRRTKLAELVGRDLAGRPIVVADHCFGCTAGQGSSCGGALA